MCLIVVAAGSAAAAQSPSGTAASTPTASTAEVPQTDGDDDAVLSQAEPDFVVINLPTGMRLPLFKGNFRLTHRFNPSGFYLNIHTARNPDGVARGQLTRAQ